MIKIRLVAERRVEAWNHRKSVEDLDVGFATLSLRRLDPVERHSHEVIVDTTKKVRIIEQPVCCSQLPVECRTVVAPSIPQYPDRPSISRQFVLELQHESPARGAQTPVDRLPVAGPVRMPQGELRVARLLGLRSDLAAKLDRCKEISSGVTKSCRLESAS